MNERYKVCGQINTVPEEGASKKDDGRTINEDGATFDGTTSIEVYGAGGRTYEGYDATRTVQQFPWAVCIKMEDVVIYKYIYMMIANKLYYRPESLKFMAGKWFKRSDRVSTLKAQGHATLASKGDSRACTGSVIRHEWIPKTAHCFVSQINAVDMRVGVGSADCDGIKSPKIKIEMVQPGPKQTIFLHPDWNTRWGFLYED